jgi:hypothetical protein
MKAREWQLAGNTSISPIRKRFTSLLWIARRILADDADSSSPRPSGFD